jgi:hypothetical protein
MGQRSTQSRQKTCSGFLRCCGKPRVQEEQPAPSTGQVAQNPPSQEAPRGAASTTPHPQQTVSSEDRGGTRIDISTGSSNSPHRQPAPSSAGPSGHTRTDISTESSNRPHRQPAPSSAGPSRHIRTDVSTGSSNSPRRQPAPSSAGPSGHSRTDISTESFNSPRRQPAPSSAGPSGEFLDVFPWEFYDSSPRSPAGPSARGNYPEVGRFPAARAGSGIQRGALSTSQSAISQLTLAQPLPALRTQSSRLSSLSSPRSRPFAPSSTNSGSSPRNALTHSSLTESSFS